MFYLGVRPSRVTQWYGVRTKFHTNLSTGSQVVNGTRTHARTNTNTHTKPAGDFHFLEEMYQYIKRNGV
jgi:hypothetical protein